MSRGKGNVRILPDLPLNYSITGEMDHNRSRRRVLVFECCHSGVNPPTIPVSTNKKQRKVYY
jgi:hypothetical protein